MGQSNYEAAIVSFLEASKYVHANIFDLNNINYRIAFCYQKLGNPKSSIMYSEKSLSGSEFDKKQLLETYKLLVEVYEQNKQPLQAFEYLKKHDKLLSDNAAENITNNIADAEIKAIIEKSDQEKQKLEQEKIQKIRESKVQRWLILSIAAALLSALVILFILNHNNRQKQKANTVLANTLSTLKSTQAQLIQSEKMASLGELIAGIAHEIQNPLNFVNNFSELNNELVTELNDQIKTINTKTTKTDEIINIQSSMLNVQELTDSIKENSEKINHHGQRASNIVKSMLEHSRTSTGKKESTDINQLCDEFLRLSYQGLRAKDQTFVSDYKTDFNVSLPEIVVNWQDIGSVLLNVINNAFYAVHERRKLNEDSYQPNVTVATRKENDKVFILVKDNGLGIPDSIKDKIFQPFFTTKPTGQGTGLGLSLAYDIVKAHGGTITVKSNFGIPAKVTNLDFSTVSHGVSEDNGTEFIINLPV